MSSRHAAPLADDELTRPLPVIAPAGLAGDEAGYVTYEGRHRTAAARSRAGVRTAAAAALFSVPTGGSPPRCSPPPPSSPPRSSRRGSPRTPPTSARRR
ncbi:hypothetical protein [Pseudonocardia sp. ICBG601]|uniref:hypothetical protein n=1 Tax=Pseudonocardia sp. ICBG601 TaxID=2846759 RepID=UPI001CF697AD|nr:hypothetical protein [Pseudonocardia sp. ICBG601]